MRTIVAIIALSVLTVSTAATAQSPASSTLKECYSQVGKDYPGAGNRGVFFADACARTR